MVVYIGHQDMSLYPLCNLVSFFLVSMTMFLLFEIKELSDLAVARAVVERVDGVLLVHFRE